MLGRSLRQAQNEVSASNLLKVCGGVLPAALSANEASYSRKNPPGDHPQRPRASQTSRPLRHSGGKGEQRPEVGAARVGDVETGTGHQGDRAMILRSRIVNAVPYLRRRGIEKCGRQRSHASSGWKTAFASERRASSIGQFTD
jgi:hypothetical protein